MNPKEREDLRRRFYQEAKNLKVEVNKEFEQALECILADENIFITGSAGVGKSMFIQLLRQSFKGNMVVTSTTGISSANIRGVTMHSMFKLPLKPVCKTSEYNKIAKSLKQIDAKMAVISNMDLLIIDEISMAKCYHLDAIDHVLRNLRDKPLVPFGGVRVILTGDIFQLEPVVSRGKDSEYEVEFLKENYDNNPYFFNSSIYRTGSFKYIEFNTIYRQKNKEFQQVLNNFRTYAHTKKDFNYINQRVIDEGDFFEGGDYVYISSTNRKAEEVNEAWLASLDGEQTVFEAETTGQTIKSNIPEVITVKPEAQIMMLKNNPLQGFYNGSLGIFKRVLDDEHVEVEIDGIRTTVALHEESLIDYEFVKIGEELRKNRVCLNCGHPINLRRSVCKSCGEELDYDSEEGLVVERVIGKKKQFPFKLAYALTVHKTQGLSLDRAYLDLGGRAFASGMSYVGLSRLRTLEGLGLKRALKPKDFIISEYLKDFLESISVDV